jgi:hypothetical protein
MAGIPSSTFAADSKGPLLSGAGWTQFGMIGNSLDTIEGKNLNGRSMISSGAQIGLEFDANDKFKIQAGLGAVAGHYLAATAEKNGGYAPVNVGPYVSEANFTYSPLNDDDLKLSFRGGFFPYDYVPDAQNLGLYLLRGPLYPGFIMSGFETKYVMPVANMLGFQIHNQLGSFQHDILLNIESDFYPYYDLSPAYLASYQAGSVLRIGGGAVLYHFISVDDRITNDKKIHYVDTVAHDTTTIPFKGIKLGANFSLDIKALFGGSEIMGPEDLKLYGEVALLGLDKGKAYKALYGSYINRMPMMAGFNVPMFKFLDRLAVEVEYYKATFKDDLLNFNHTSGSQPVPFPVADTVKYTKDDIKWSIYGSKVLKEHIKLSFQVASDHFRPGIFNGYGDNNPPGSEAIFLSPSEWYWETKLAFFF